MSMRSVYDSEIVLLVIHLSIHTVQHLFPLCALCYFNNSRVDLYKGYNPFHSMCTYA